VVEAGAAAFTLRAGGTRVNRVGGIPRGDATPIDVTCR
jgi:hypothetical protein